VGSIRSIVGAQRIFLGLGSLFMRSLSVDSASLRKRAMQCRHLADGMSDQESRDRLFSFASDYERMAAQTERSLETVQAPPARRQPRAGTRVQLIAKGRSSRRRR